MLMGMSQKGRKLISTEKNKTDYCFHLGKKIEKFAHQKTYCHFNVFKVINIKFSLQKNYVNDI